MVHEVEGHTQIDQCNQGVRQTVGGTNLIKKEAHVRLEHIVLTGIALSYQVKKVRKIWITRSVHNHPHGV